ncbi:MAG: deoxyhypusine synthase [Methanomassiliicoccales archaeon]|nr:deoxyhypusine synthase [Methanomassiliicoccales archaeon]NYT16126.1 deoxyhypusine synthase [Methanomassiliicoccales archaeon]
MKMKDWKPVEDIKIINGMSVDALVREMGRSGGFTGRKVAEAVDILENMFKRDNCVVFLSFPACIMATGTRGVIVEMIKRSLVDVIITTCGTLDHDLARVWRDYYHGDFFMDDAELRHQEVNRLGNVLVPDDSYGIVLEERLVPLFREILEGRDSISTRELIEEVGKRIGDEGSLLHWCARKGVRVYVPGITDGSFGSQLWMYWQTHRNLKLDLFRDEQELSDIAFEADETGALIIGGGISKHHVIWWNQFRGGLDYAVYLTTAPEYDGSLSGARVREAVSWGKVKETADQLTVEGDATITLPLIAASVIERLEGED